MTNMVHGTPAPPDPARIDRLRTNAAAVRERIARAAEAAGRNRADIRLVAVSKTFPLSSIEAAAAAGLTDLGENRVQEALQKIGQTSELQIRWHLIGHLQSNKARSAAAAFAWIHSVDSVKLLRRLDRAAADLGTTPNVLVQVDLAGEATKSGAAIDEARRMFDAASACPAARIRGLMLMPPWRDDPEDVRPYFRRLRELRDTLAGEGVDSGSLGELSMGMTRDFEVAIQEGATMVRVGTAIFGRRTPPPPRPSQEGHS